MQEGVQLLSVEKEGILPDGAMAMNGTHVAEGKIGGRAHDREFRAESLWSRVREALAAPEWDFRTAEGIANELGAPVDVIDCLLREHDAEVRQAGFTDDAGARLYTLRDRGQTAREMWNTVVALGGWYVR